MLPLIRNIICLKAKHSLKPIQEVLVNFMLISFGPWKTSSIAKSRSCSLDLGKFHDSLIATIWIKRENVEREIDFCLLFNLISSFQDLMVNFNGMLLSNCF
uniref:Uncharacterized protein n=1 Tax=Arundo donax TaxID=35708 RepID=A0A0A9CZ45_ARUDO